MESEEVSKINLAAPQPPDSPAVVDRVMSYRWLLPDLSPLPHSLKSGTFVVGGINCHLIFYPQGNSVSVKGYCSVQLQMLSPSKSLLRCRLSISKPSEPRTFIRDSLVPISSKCFWWTNFALEDTCYSRGVITIEVSREKLTLKDNELLWRTSNANLISRMIESKGPLLSRFVADGKSFVLRVGSHVTEGVKHISAWLDSVEAAECSCLFQLSLRKVQNEKTVVTLRTLHTFGRFEEANPSLGWADFVTMDEFLKAGGVEFRAVVRVMHDRFTWDDDGKFTWEIVQFPFLKKRVKKMGIQGLCITSPPFLAGDKYWRLKVYPRGQHIRDPRELVDRESGGQIADENHVPVGLELVDREYVASDWWCKVTVRLELVNKDAEKSISLETDLTFSKSAYDFGWANLIARDCVFDRGAGFLFDDDTIKVTLNLIPLSEGRSISYDESIVVDEPDFKWEVENFPSKEATWKDGILAVWGPKMVIPGVCDLEPGIVEHDDSILLYMKPGETSQECFWIEYMAGLSSQGTKIGEFESSFLTEDWKNASFPMSPVTALTKLEGTVIFGCIIIHCRRWIYLSNLKDVKALYVFPQFALKAEQRKELICSACNLLTGCNDDKQIIRFILHTAKHYRCLNSIIMMVRGCFESSINRWDSGFTDGLLHLVAELLHSNKDVAKALLENIGVGSLFDIHIMMELFSMEDMFSEVFEAFRRTLEHGIINVKLIAAVLDTRQHISRFQIKEIAKGDFHVAMKCCERLSLVLDDKMRSFSCVLSAVLLIIYQDCEQHIIQNSQLVDALSAVDTNILLDVAEECDAVKPVFSMLHKWVGIGKDHRANRMKSELQLSCSIKQTSSVLDILTGSSPTSISSLIQESHVLENKLGKKLSKIVGKVDRLKKDVDKLRDLTSQKNHIVESRLEFSKEKFLKVRLLLLTMVAIGGIRMCTK